MTRLKNFLKKFHIFSKEERLLHILITISSIIFDRKFYEKYFLYHTTQLIETNRSVYKFIKMAHFFLLKYKKKIKKNNNFISVRMDNKY